MVRAVIRVPYSEEPAPSIRPGQKNITEPHAPAFIPKSANLMSKVPSLMFDMEDTEDTPASSKTPLNEPAEADVIEKLQSLLGSWDDQEYMLALHVRIARDEANKRGHEHLSVPKLADTLRKLGYPVKIRTALGGGWGGACLRNLRHSFLAVTISNNSHHHHIHTTISDLHSTAGATKTASIATSAHATRIVLVDPRFRDQFEIAHSTRRYANILKAVPDEAVATPDRLSKAVQLLCTEISFAFAEAATPLPPWRQTTAMLSKWQPRRSQEVDVKDIHALDAAALNNNSLAKDRGCPKDEEQSDEYDNNFDAHHTVAQKLASLGFEANKRASPISEGQEGDIDGEEDRFMDNIDEDDDEFSVSLATPTATSSDEDDAKRLKEGGPFASVIAMVKASTHGAKGKAASKTAGANHIKGNGSVLSNNNNEPMPFVEMFASEDRAATSTEAEMEAAQNHRLEYVWKGIRDSVANRQRRRFTWA